MPTTPNCGENITVSTPTYKFAPWPYGIYSYPPNSYCVWYIRPTEGHGLKMDTQDLFVSLIRFFFTTEKIRYLYKWDKKVLLNFLWHASFIVKLKAAHKLHSRWKCLTLPRLSWFVLTAVLRCSSPAEMRTSDLFSLRDSESLFICCADPVIE